MCDYSLEKYASRPARKSEKYVSTHFPSFSIGVTEPEDCGTAVCIEYGTRLKLTMPRELQISRHLDPEETVTFVRMNECHKHLHHDGVRFKDGREILLQQLGPGIGIELAAKPKVISFGENDPGYDARTSTVAPTAEEWGGLTTPAGATAELVDV